MIFVRLVRFLLDYWFVKDYVKDYWSQIFENHEFAKALGFYRFGHQRSQKVKSFINHQQDYFFLWIPRNIENNWVSPDFVTQYCFRQFQFSHAATKISTDFMLLHSWKRSLNTKIVGELCFQEKFSLFSVYTFSRWTIALQRRSFNKQLVTSYYDSIFLAFQYHELLNPVWFHGLYEVCRSNMCCVKIQRSVAQ